MKAFIAFFATLFLFLNCQKIHEESNNSLFSKDGLADQQVSKRPDQVTLCHRKGDGSYIAMVIFQNALSNHLAHGDQLVDADGDGYSAVGACTGSANDCNDNDAGINPGAQEVCGDGNDNNCNNSIDENCCAIPSDMIGSYTGSYVKLGETYRVDLQVSSESINVRYDNCSAIWSLDCVNSTLAEYAFTEVITSGSCTPACLIRVRYQTNSNTIDFRSSSTTECQDINFIIGRVFR